MRLATVWAAITVLSLIGLWRSRRHAEWSTQREYALDRLLGSPGFALFALGYTWPRIHPWPLRWGLLLAVIFWAVYVVELVWRAAEARGRFGYGQRGPR